MARKKESQTGKIIAVIVVLLFLGVIAYFFISSETAGTDIPGYVTGEKRMAYEWAQTEQGAAILEQLPCYCGCKYEGHKHTRHCFWDDEGNFDKHGITCSVCLDIALKAKSMTEDGNDICSIRKEIDVFYEPNKHLATATPMPKECL